MWLEDSSTQSHTLDHYVQSVGTEAGATASKAKDRECIAVQVDDFNEMNDERLSERDAEDEVFTIDKDSYTDEEDSDTDEEDSDLGDVDSALEYEYDSSLDNGDGNTDNSSVINEENFNIKEVLDPDHDSTLDTENTDFETLFEIEN